MPSKDPEAPLNRAATKMVEFYRKYRDLYKAAERAHVPKNQAVKIFNSPPFQEELARQEEAVLLERARQEVVSEKLTNDAIDRELMRVMLLSAEKHGTLKLEAIRLAGVMTGRIQAGNTKALDPQTGDGAGSAGAFSYKALVQVQPADPILPDQPVPAANTAPVAAAAAASAMPAAPLAQPAAGTPAARPPAPPKAPEPPKPQSGRPGVIRLG